MGLQPLEFSDCLTDSPYFRDKLHTHEKELERTSKSIKGLISEAKDLVTAAKNLSKAQRTLSHTLKEFKFECIGSQQTEDEMIIESSLQEFGKLIGTVEDQRDLMLEKAYEQIISPLEGFRKKHIGGAKDGRKSFEKQTSKFNQSLEKYLNLKSKSNDTVLKEADAALMMERKHFYQASMTYVLLLQEVQERKKFEFVEILLMLMYSFLTFYHQGHEVAKDFTPYMSDLQYKLQKCRGNFDVTHEESHQLMTKMLEKQEQTQNLRLREGYLYMLEKKTIGTSWTKIYCKYEKQNKLLKLLPYSQTAPVKDFTKLIPETWILESCVRRASDSIDKRFCFDVTVKDKANATFTFQALSEEDRKLWMDAMGGKEPIYSQPTNSNERDTQLDEIGFTFIRRCINAIESRGLDDEGLYRVVGVASKVNKLITMGLDRRKMDKLNFDSEDNWEIKTITSALKNYFRSLPEPIMTFKLYSPLIDAAKRESSLRIQGVHELTHLLPKSHFDMLSILIKHLKGVAKNHNNNLMTVPNLGVCFGPTLMRHQEETMAAIMDIKWCNIVVEILIDNFDTIFLKSPESNNTAVVGDNRVLNSTSVITNTRPNPPHNAMSTSAYSALDPTRQSVYDNHKPNIPDIPKPKKGIIGGNHTTAGGNHTTAGGNHTAGPVSKPPHTTTDRMSNSTTAPSTGNKSPPVYGGYQGDGGETYAKYRAKLRPTGDHNSSRSSSSESLNSRSSGTTHQSNSSINTGVQKGNMQNAGGGHVAQAVNRFSTAPMQTPSPVEARSSSTSSVSSMSAPNNKPRGKKVRTLYDCQAENDSELSFEPNQIILNVHNSKEPGWLEGTLEGKTGLIPANYVEYINGE